MAIHMTRRFVNSTALSLCKRSAVARSGRAACWACLGMMLLAAIAAGQENDPAPAATSSPAGEAPKADPATAPPSDPATAEKQPAAAPPRSGPTDRAELAAFLDGIMAVQLKDKHIAGATIAVVVNGEPFFAKGYGYADVEAKKPVNPDETMFRIGSVSKLFTWTAVMQLVEQGKLDLDADVNQYLKEFKIPATYPQPITLKHLLTHTPGFEDHVIGLFARDHDKVSPLGPLLSRELPARVRPPGELASYSNHGTALAGYIVSVVSGMPWEDYVEQNILTPLGMTHTSVRQPAADQLPAAMSKGYKFERGRFKEQGFEYVPIAPAGSISASAADMARFMIAHLQDGRYESARILKEETARQMRQLLFTHDPRIEGMAYGFMRARYNGREIVGHGGDTFWFHSLLVMLPQENSGFFVSYNTDTATGVREALMEAFLDRYYPAGETPPNKPPADFQSRAARYAGSYGTVRNSYTSPARLGSLLTVAQVSADGDALVLKASTVTRRFVEVEPLLFNEIDGQSKLAFREDARGRVTQMFVDGSPEALVRLPWYETPTFALALVGGCVALLLSAVVGWPWAAFIARGRREAEEEPTAGARVASWVAWLACLAILAWMTMLATALVDPFEIAYGMPPFVAALLRWSPLLAALVACVALCAIVAWLKGYWRLSARLHYTCVLAAGVALVWFLHYWNLLKFGA